MHRLRAPDPLIVVIVALLCASVLVLYLQRRALLDLERQRAVILRTMASQRAMTVAAEIRKTFDGPVRDVLLATNPPLLAAERLDLVAVEYERGLKEYPQVERFFMWSGATETIAPGEVLFYGARPATSFAAAGTGDEADLFYRDSPVGRYILAQARQHAKSRRIYAAFKALTNGMQYDVFIRIFYTDAIRNEYFAVRGFAVKVSSIRSHIFPAVYKHRLAALLESQDGSPPFELRVIDESGTPVFGPGLPTPALSATESFLLQFYPVEDIESRLAASIPARRWTLVISPRPENAGTVASTWMQGYWFSALSVVLMLVALVFAVQSRRRATRLAHMQADFVTQVSHQLKTPVALLSAVGETMALQRPQSPEKLAQCVNIVQTESSRLTALVDRVLELSRISDGGRRYELESVDLGSLARETVEAFARALESSGFRLAVVENGASPIVLVDPAALEQVLINLLDNAIKYSGDTKVVTVTVGIDGNDATLAVTDHGIGISPDQQHRIFERFYRGKSGVLHREGFGLGLAIAHEVVAAHRGRIEVESNVGVGSTFRVIIPRHRSGWGRVRGTDVPSGEST